MSVLRSSLVVSAILAGGLANAATLSFSAALPLAPTNFTGNVVSVSQFDPSLGMLNSVTVSLKGLVEGEFDVESLDASPTTVTTEVSATITASTAAIDPLVVTLPAITETFNLAAFDGDIDFDGPSGETRTGLTSEKTETVTLTGADMAEFIGLGAIDLFLDGISTSMATGSGNLITRFLTSAGAEIEVVYDFDSVTAPVPTPAALPLMLAGLGGLAFLRRRRGA